MYGILKNSPLAKEMAVKAKLRKEVKTIEPEEVDLKTGVELPPIPEGDTEYITGTSKVEEKKVEKVSTKKKKETKEVK